MENKASHTLNNVKKPFVTFKILQREEGKYIETNLFTSSFVDNACLCEHFYFL